VECKDYAKHSLSQYEWAKELIPKLKNCLETKRYLTSAAATVKSQQSWLKDYVATTYSALIVSKTLSRWRAVLFLRTAYESLFSKDGCASAYFPRKI
jgi:hypothetical protein